MVTDRYGDETDENDSDNVAEDYKQREFDAVCIEEVHNKSEANNKVDLTATENRFKS